MIGASRFSPGRRKLLIGASAGVLILGAGAASWGRLTNYRAEWVEQVVRDNLPGIDIDAASLKTFIDHILATDRMRPATVKATVFADQFIPWLPAQVAKARAGLEGLERHVLTEYLIGSNFFRVSDPRRETITYSGPAIACTNPFMYG
jgi:hypothetical protein